MAVRFQEDATELLHAWGEGDTTALDKLTPLVHKELHRLARHYMRGERPDHTLQATALVNEAYLRLIDWKNARWQNRAYFAAVAAQLMRRILVDHARSRHYAKRGGGAQRVSLNDVVLVSEKRAPEVIALDDALRRLDAIDPRKGQVVELRFFGGLSVKETAEVLKVSPQTVLRDWDLAKAWLHREISEKDEDEA